MFLLYAAAVLGDRDDGILSSWDWTYSWVPAVRGIKGPTRET